MRVIVIAAALGLSGCADYTSVLDTWPGASEAELVARWGEPQGSSHTDKDGTTVYVYRSYPYAVHGFPCEVTFTLQNGRVSGGRYWGDSCPEVGRWSSLELTATTGSR